MKARTYDLMYRFWAPWDATGVRSDLISLLDSGRVDPERYPRSIDLGCGSGANAVYLAEQGFNSHGVDFSRLGLRQAEQRAAEAGVDCTFVLADLTAESIGDLDGSFDFLIDFGTLDDLRGDDRRAMARTIDRLARPGSVFLEWCFYGAVEELPAFSLSGPSRAFLPPDRARTRIAPTLEPGEVDELFGAAWDIEPLNADPEHHWACFVLVKRT